MNWTRLTLFPMPQNDFQMKARQRAYRANDRESFLRSIGLRLEQDLCLGYFRKRIPVLIMRSLTNKLTRSVSKDTSGVF